MTSPALRVAEPSPTTGPTRTHGAAYRLFEDLVSRHFARLVILVLFVIFVAALAQMAVMLRMSNSLNGLDAVVSEISTTTRGNRVVSCADLSLQAPNVAASLPQCAAQAPSAR